MYFISPSTPPEHLKADSFPYKTIIFILDILKRTPIMFVSQFCYTDLGLKKSRRKTDIPGYGPKMQKDAVIFSLGNYSHLDSEIKHVF